MWKTRGRVWVKSSPNMTSLITSIHLLHFSFLSFLFTLSYSPPHPSACSILSTCGKGTYLVRYSTSAPGHFTISTRTQVTNDPMEDFLHMVCGWNMSVWDEKGMLVQFNSCVWFSWLQTLNSRDFCVNFVLMSLWWTLHSENKTRAADIWVYHQGQNLLLSSSAHITGESQSFSLHPRPFLSLCSIAVRRERSHCFWLYELVLGKVKIVFFKGTE